MLPKYNRRKIKIETSKIVAIANKERQAEKIEETYEDGVPIPDFMDRIDQRPHPKWLTKEITQHRTVLM